MQTRVLKVTGGEDLGKFWDGEGAEALGLWEVPAAEEQGQGSGSPSTSNGSSSSSSNGSSGSSLKILRETAAYLRTRDAPVAIPTETVYGLAADATRSAAVRGIYEAKGRPSDNPLIIHVSDLSMLREVLTPASPPVPSHSVTNGAGSTETTSNGTAAAAEGEIPAIYMPLIQRFWPGPLTILLPNPSPSRLAPEVTAGLRTFGARMPASGLARSLIRLTGRPLAAPSANASTRPSPTAAEHVLEDLRGRIELVLDGGPCPVGVESTVVDGLCHPPAVLRPGGVAIEDLRACPGWENVEKAYRDQAETSATTGDKPRPPGTGPGMEPEHISDAPRAPGMKYKHYSPRARVVLYEADCAASRDGVREEDLAAFRRDWRAAGEGREEEGEEQQQLKVGIIRTRHWKPGAGLQRGAFEHRETVDDETSTAGCVELAVQEAEVLPPAGHDDNNDDNNNNNDSGGSGSGGGGKLLDLGIGSDTRSIAQGLFSALRELDRRGAHVIFVEGIEADRGEDIGAAVMNRLRKAASLIRA